MSQKKVLLYSPDGKEENWFMEDEAPAGWVRHKPQVEYEGEVLPGGGDPTLKGYDPPGVMEVGEAPFSNKGTQMVDDDKRYEIASEISKLTDDERLAEAERLQGEGRMEEAEVVLEETQDDGH